MEMSRLLVFSAVVLLSSGALMTCLAQDGDLGDLAGGLGGLLSALAGGLEGGDSCHHRCGNGRAARPRPGHKPRFNGCGTGGLRVDVSDFPGFEECCNQHDVCYDTCNELRDDCDQAFQQCMMTVCKRQKKAIGKHGNSASKREQCTSQASLMYGGVTVFGCDAYLESQKEACKCIRPHKTGF